MTKPNYFSQDAPDPDDMFSLMARQPGYVPTGCLLGGAVAMGLVMDGKDPCTGCAGPREKCKGRKA